MFRSGVGTEVDGKAYPYRVGAFRGPASALGAIVYGGYKGAFGAGGRARLYSAYQGGLGGWLGRGLRGVLRGGGGCGCGTVLGLCY